MGSRFYSKRLPRMMDNSAKQPRPKSFKSEESATAWAKAQGIASFDLKNLKNDHAKEKKIVVVPK